MKAAVCTEYGGPDKVYLAEVPEPSTPEGYVKIKIECTTVNRTDTGFRTAEYVISRLWSGILRPKNPILGNEFSGVITEIGNGVNRFKLGDRVFGYDDVGFGCHAAYKTIKEQSAILHMPDSWDFESAAAMIEGAHYALCNLKAAKIKAGSEILVYGATGGIGSSAVQLAVHMGAQVTAVCAGKHQNLIQELGAHRTIDYETEEVYSDHSKYDLFFDAVGKCSFGKSKHLLKAKGVYISTELGPGGQNPFLAMLSFFKSGKKVLFPIPSIHLDDLKYLSEARQKGAYKPLIDRVMHIDDIKEAHAYVQSGQKIGNVVIRMA